MVTFRRLENQAIGALVRQIHERRAFVEIVAPSLMPAARASDDFGRVSRSVITARQEIDVARRSVGRSKELQDALTSMKLACNRYLELSAQTPERYVIQLTQLRDELWDDIRRLHASRPSLPSLLPGSGFF
jgi:hypothetical protein